MKIKLLDILKNGIWMTLPPLLFSLIFMNMLPAAFAPDIFNKNIPDVIFYSENLFRFLVFAVPAFFSIGIFTKTQKRGLILYLTGIILYCLSYYALIVYPDSLWSTGLVGFTAPAYSNIFWMTGLGLLGDRFYYTARFSYHPVFYLSSVIAFLFIHTTHTVIVYHRSFYYLYY